MINPNIYGHFMEHLGACVYEGVWLNEGGLCGDVIDALRPVQKEIGLNPIAQSNQSCAESA